MRTKKLVRCSLFAVLIGVASQINIPIQPVPLNLGLLAVLVSSGIQGVKYGTFSAILYILLGCCGVPVFASFRGGLGVIADVTGGYILGYGITALMSVLARDKKLPIMLVLYALGVLFCYVTGTLWYVNLTGTSVPVAVSLCVIPFIPADIIKIIFGAFVTKKLKKLI